MAATASLPVAEQTKKRSANDCVYVIQLAFDQRMKNLVKNNNNTV